MSEAGLVAVVECVIAVVVLPCEALTSATSAHDSADVARAVAMQPATSDMNTNLSAFVMLMLLLPLPLQGLNTMLSSYIRAFLPESDRT